MKHVTRKWLIAVFSAFLFLVAFIPRALDPVARSLLWHKRGKTFMEALADRNWAETLQSTHPGVITMWLVGTAQKIGRFFVPSYDDQPLTWQLQIEVVSLALAIAIVIVVVFFLLRHLFNWQTAVFSSMLLALDPFHIFLSKTVHVDALMSTFALAAALAVLVYTRRPDSRWALWLSAVFTGLALLTKLPSLFLVPYTLLCLGMQQIVSHWTGWRGLANLRLWQTMSKNMIRPLLIWFAIILVVFVVLFPAMWSIPTNTYDYIFSRISHHVTTAHPNPVLFWGKTTMDDPGQLFYPAVMVFLSAEIAFVSFFLGVAALFSRHLPRDQRLTLWLMLGFILFFTLQMNLGAKKSERYILPAYQFIVLVGGIGLTFWLRRWLGKHRSLFTLTLAGLVLIQAGLTLPRHPYYGTHYNWLVGGPSVVLKNNLLAGQEQGEGLAIAANYLNQYPLSKTLVVGTQTFETFYRHFQGKSVSRINEQVDYLVFARNPIVRGNNYPEWETLWNKYRQRAPKLIVSFDDVPYVWVYKTGPEITDETPAQFIDAQVGDGFRLIGYDFEPDQITPGDSVKVTLYWEALNTPQQDLTVFVHLLNSEGELSAQSDNQPQDGKYPTHFWHAGERVQDEYILQIAPDAAPGSYQFAIGMYFLETLERLPVVDANGITQSDNLLLLPGPELALPSP